MSCCLSWNIRQVKETLHAQHLLEGEENEDFGTEMGLLKE